MVCKMAAVLGLLLLSSNEGRAPVGFLGDAVEILVFGAEGRPGPGGECQTFALTCFLTPIFFSIADGFTRIGLTVLHKED